MRYSNSVGFYELNSFPGCNQIVISNHAFIYSQFRGQGIGQEQHKERLNTASAAGYNYVMCTVKADNDVERHILRKHGWKFLDQFHNMESGSLVEIWGQALDQDVKTYNKGNHT